MENRAETNIVYVPAEESEEAVNKQPYRTKHVSILSGEAVSLSLHRCLIPGCCGNLVHCPFCDVQQYKPAQPARVQDHLHLSHFQYAVYYDGLMVIKCFHPCRGPVTKGGHYHCPVCDSTLLKRNAFVQHLRSHEAQDGLEESSVHAPDAKQPSVVHFQEHDITLCHDRCENTLSAHYHCPLCRQTCTHLAPLTAHLWRCKKRAVTVSKIGEKGEITNTAELFSAEAVKLVTHPKYLPNFKWHLSIVRNLSDLPLSRCGLESCCKGRYHCPLCTTGKLKPNFLCHMRQHFLSHWRSGVPFNDYTVLVCYLPCQVVQPTDRIRFHYHCPLCGTMRRRREAFACHLMNCNPLHPQTPTEEEEYDDAEFDDDGGVQEYTRDLSNSVPMANAEDGKVDIIRQESDVTMPKAMAAEVGITQQKNGDPLPTAKAAEIGIIQQESGDLMQAAKAAEVGIIQHESFDSVPVANAKSGKTGITWRESADSAELQAAESLADMDRIVSESTGRLVSTWIDDKITHGLKASKNSSLIMQIREKDEILHIAADDLQSNSNVITPVPLEDNLLQESHKQKSVSGNSDLKLHVVDKMDQQTILEQKLLPEAQDSSEAQECIANDFHSKPAKEENTNVKDQCTTDNFQVFELVTTSISSHIISELRSRGELDASLKALGEICGVTCRQSSADVTVECHPEDLCRVQDCLRQIVRGGLQTFLKSPTVTQGPLLTNHLKLPAVPKRKRGRPRGSKNKHAMVLEEYSSPEKQRRCGLTQHFTSECIKHHTDETLSNDVKENQSQNDLQIDHNYQSLAMRNSPEETEHHDSHASIITAYTENNDGVYRRTRGKHIDFVTLNSGDFPLLGSPSDRRETYAKPLSNASVKQTRGRPRKNTVVIDVLVERGDNSVAQQELLQQRNVDIELTVESFGKETDANQCSQISTAVKNTVLEITTNSSKVIPPHLDQAQAQRSSDKGHNSHITSFKIDSISTLDAKSSNSTEDGKQVILEENNISAQTQVNSSSYSSTTETFQKFWNSCKNQTLQEQQNQFRIKASDPDSKNPANKEKYRCISRAKDFVIIPSVIFDYSTDNPLDLHRGRNTDDDSLNKEDSIEIWMNSKLRISRTGKENPSSNKEFKQIRVTRYGGETSSAQMGEADGIVPKTKQSGCTNVEKEMMTDNEEREAAPKDGAVDVCHNDTSNTVYTLCCPVCQTAFVKYGELRDHLAVQHPKSSPLACDVCEIVCLSTASLILHVEHRHGPKVRPPTAMQFVCTCGKSCPTITSLRWHQSFVHKQSLAKRRAPLKLCCGLCGHHALDAWDMRHHRDLHHGQPSTCPFCNKRLSSDAAVKVHVAAKHSNAVFSCHLCSKTFAHARYLRSHLRRHSGEKRHVCKTCGWRFHETNTLRAHMETHKPRPQRTYAFNCPHCSAGYNNRANLRDHLNKHTGAKPHTCSLCGKGFAFRSMLTTHHAFVHSIERPHACTHCPKSFKTKVQLQQHMPIHTGISNYICSKCGRALASKSRLKVHASRCKGNNSASNQGVVQSEPKTVSLLSNTGMDIHSLNAREISDHSVHLVSAQTSHISKRPESKVNPIFRILSSQKRTVLHNQKEQIPVLPDPAQDDANEDCHRTEMSSTASSSVWSEDKINRNSTLSSLAAVKGQYKAASSSSEEHILADENIISEDDNGTQASANTFYIDSHEEMMSEPQEIMSDTDAATEYKTHTLILPPGIDKQILLIENEFGHHFINLDNAQIININNRSISDTEYITCTPESMNNYHEVQITCAPREADAKLAVYNFSSNGTLTQCTSSNQNQDLAIVVESVANKDEEKSVIYLCNTCQHAFDSFTSAKSHVLIEHSLEPEVNANILTEDQGPSLES